jgi:hypothetical protein
MGKGSGDLIIVKWMAWTLYGCAIIAFLVLAIDGYRWVSADRASGTMMQWPRYLPFLIAFVLLVGAVVLGYGLSRRREWGRVATIGVCYALMLIAVGMVVYWLTNSLVETWYDRVAEATGVVFTALLGAGMLCRFLRALYSPAVVASFRPGAEGSREGPPGNTQGDDTNESRNEG